MSLILAILLSAVAQGASLAEGQVCLASNDVPCALEVVQKIGAETSANPEARAFAAEAYFYAGDFARAKELIDQAVANGWEDRWDEAALYERTVKATEDWTEAHRDRFRIRYQPGIDAVLLDDAAETLVSAERHFTPLLGEGPPGTITLELYPDGRSFIAASSLTKENVETTGVVALSKWSRLLVTSPRALGRGYGWTDTIAHEYVHLVVAYQTQDRAPVWLQEAIAKYLDNRWRSGHDGFRLSVGAQGLLAQAIKDDKLVTFDEMHPSLAKLESPEKAALAYAQLSTLMAYCFQRAGEDVLLKVLPRVKKGVDPRIALADAVGAASFTELETDWKQYVRGLNLITRDVRELPTVIDGGDDLDSDPLLAEREDLARFVRLGDLLAEKGRYQAALVEYDKAVPRDEPMGPLLANRIALAYLAQDELVEAIDVLEKSLANYPEFSLSHKTHGAILRRLGRKRAALDAYSKAAEFNPFDPDVQRSLSELHAELGDDGGATRHMRYLRILRPNI